MDNKDYDSEKLSDKGKIYLGRLQNLQVKLQQITLEVADINVLKKHYSELLKKELPKEEEVKEVKSDKK
jgi:hypothetical protein